MICIKRILQKLGKWTGNSAQRCDFGENLGSLSTNSSCMSSTTNLYKETSLRISVQNKRLTMFQGRGSSMQEKNAIQVPVSVGELFDISWS